MKLATAAARSANKKIGACAATYAAQASCPKSCAFYNGGGCYAENGMLYSGVTKPLNDTAELLHATPVDVAIAEAAVIDELEAIPGRPMRLHTVGDCTTDECALIVSAASERYMARGGGPVWTYTHAWRLVDRESWGAVSALASCETPEQVELALARGYAPSIVVDEFEQRTKYVLSSSGLELLPCPAQTHDHIACSDCRLCMNDGGLRERGYAIAFEVHGTAFTVRQARLALAAPSDERRRLTLRQLIPEYLETHPGASDVRMARDLGYAQASVIEMHQKLRREDAANAA